MKSRKGMILLDALLALLLLSALAAGIFPLAGTWMAAVRQGTIRTKMEETGLFAMDFMVEKIRNNRRPMAAGGIRDSRYDYTAVTESGQDGTYRFFVDREKLKIELYNGLIQPVTGEYTGPEKLAFLPGKESLFRQEEAGPLRISFILHHQMSRTDREYETSVIPYADFYQKGKTYE